MTAQTRFTPGPWDVVIPDRDSQWDFPGVDTADGELSIVVYGVDGDDGGVRGRTLEEALANAALIASATRLYAALETMLEGWDCLCDLYGWDKDHTKASAEARAALKQARGEA